MASEILEHTRTPRRQYYTKRSIVGWTWGLLIAMIFGALFFVAGGTLHNALADGRLTLVRTTSDFRDLATTEVVVRPGDTLWTIARTYGPEGRDVREVVDWIRQINGLQSGSIQVDQVLLVPVIAPGQ